METSIPRGPAARPLLLGLLIGLAGGAIGAAAIAMGGTASAAPFISGVGVAGLVGAILAALIGFAPRRQAEAAATAPRPPRPAAEAKAEIPADRVDPLTGLANANGLAAWFVERRGRLIEDGKGVVVLVANLEAFDQVEKLRGKETADSVLREVAKRVAVFAGEDGIAARTGGDEFVAVATTVPERAVEFAEEKAGKMAETIGRPVELGAGALWIGGSVGAAVGRPQEGDGILARARRAFDEARKLGLGRYVVDRGSGN
jgi:diguanylate cyclase (GGDEF)-like protein